MLKIFASRARRIGPALRAMELLVWLAACTYARYHVSFSACVGIRLGRCMPRLTAGRPSLVAGCRISSSGEWKDDQVKNDIINAIVQRSCNQQASGDLILVFDTSRVQRADLVPEDANAPVGSFLLRITFSGAESSSPALHRSTVTHILGRDFRPHHASAHGLLPPRPPHAMHTILPIH